MPARSSDAVIAPNDPTDEEPAIWEFATSNVAPEQIQEATHLLNNKELLRIVRKLTPEDQTKFVERIDQAYPTINSQNAKFVAALGNVCSATERLPTSVVLSAGLEKRGNIAVASGGLNDVWRGEWGGTQVAIRSFRIGPGHGLNEAKAILWRRAPMWRKLSHENVLSFCGVDMTLFRLALIYDWGLRGNINQYISSHPGASRLSLLFDVAKGLRYLHSLDIPHGGLKGANVVVNEGGRALLTEYGLASINFGPRFTEAATPGVIGTSRWLAPEILSASREDSSTFGMESKPADVYAFAMLAVEAFTGMVPLEGRKNESVMHFVLEGGRPEMPANAQVAGLTSEIWDFLESCWEHNPEKRPTVEEVVRRWEKFVERSDDDDIIVTEEPQPIVEPAPGPGPLLGRFDAVRCQLVSEGVRDRTESGPPRHRTEPGPPRPRTLSSPIQPRTPSCPVPFQTESGIVRLRTDSIPVRLRTDSGPFQLRLSVERIRTTPDAVPPRTKPEAIPPQTKHMAVPPQTKPKAVPPQKEPEIAQPQPRTRKRWKRWFCGLF